MKKTEVFDLTLTSVFIAIILMMSLVQQLGFITILPGVAITLVHIPTLIGIFILKPKYGLMLGITFGIGSMIAAFMYGQAAFDLAFQNPLVSVLPRALFGIAAWGLFQGLRKISLINYGKYIIFGFVSLVASVAIIFGSMQIAKNAIWNNYNLAVQQGTDEETLSNLFNEASQNESSTMSILVPIVIVVAVAFVGFYLYLTFKNKDNEIYVLSSFILGTLVHTVLVLTAVILFGDVLKIAFGDAVTFIYGIAAGNGLIEALAAGLIGTPVYLALKNVPQLQNKK